MRSFSFVAFAVTMLAIVDNAQAGARRSVVVSGSDCPSCRQQVVSTYAQPLQVVQQAYAVEAVAAPVAYQVAQPVVVQRAVQQHVVQQQVVQKVIAQPVIQQQVVRQKVIQPVVAVQRQQVEIRRGFLGRIRQINVR